MHRENIMYPFIVTNTLCEVDANITVKGGGVMG
jgi:ribosomal protein S9